MNLIVFFKYTWLKDGKDVAQNAGKGSLRGQAHGMTVSCFKKYFSVFSTFLQ